MIFTFALFDSQTPIESLDIPERSFEYHVLQHMMNNSGKHLRKTDFARVFDLQGSHEQFETPRKRTSVRKIHQIIHNLREANVPIVSDSKGTWIAQSKAEIKEFAAWLERKARADISTMRHVQKKLLSMARIESPSFEEIW